MPIRTHERELTRGLWLRDQAERASVLVDRPDGHLPLAQIAFESRRARILLCMFGGRRLLDVSVQPGAFARVVASEALGAHRDGNAWCSAVEAAVARSACERSMWRRSEAAMRGLVPLLTGLAFPVLASAYDLGARPVAEVPRWAEHVLSRATAREAAVAAFGTRATRRTTRALACSLVPDADAPDGATVALGPLCLALIGRNTLEPDQIVEVLSATRVWHASPAWLPTGRLEASARVLSGLGPSAATRLLLDAAGEQRGIEVLIDTLDLYQHLRHHFPTAPPGRLDALRGACSELAPAPIGPTVAAATPRRRVESRRRNERHGAQHHGSYGGLPQVGALADVAAPPVEIFTPRNAPHTRSIRLPATFLYPTVLRELEHTSEGDIRLVLPHTPSELAGWGNRLGNCLGTFTRAVATGASWIIGVEHCGVLAACAEIDPTSRRVRQLLAAHNRPPSAALVESTLHLLVDRGAIRAVSSA